MNDEGRKDDAGKTAFEYISPEAMIELARVLEFGARKYAPRNWEKGMAWGRVFGAMMRHAWAWWRGENNDPETGLSHMAHALCCAMFLLHYSIRRTGTDDRPVSQPARYTAPETLCPSCRGMCVFIDATVFGPIGSLCPRCQGRGSMPVE